MLIMSGLRKFIGSREGGGNLPVVQDQSDSHNRGKQQRMRATIQRMGFTDLNGDEILSDSTSEYTNDVRLSRKKTADELRLKVPIRPLSRDHSGPMVLQGMKKSYDSTTDPSLAEQDISEEHHKAPQGLFETDAESLEVTATLSDFTDIRDPENSLQGDRHSEIRSDQMRDDDQIVLPPIEKQQRRRSQISQLSVELNAQNLLADRDQSEFGANEDESSDEEQSKHDEEVDDRWVNRSKAHKPTNRIEEPIASKSYRVDSLQAGNGNLRLDPVVSLDSPTLYQDSVRRHNNHPSRESIIPITSETEIGVVTKQKARGRRLRLPQASVKPDLLRSVGHAQNDFAGDPWLLQEGVPKNGSSDDLRNFEEGKSMRHSTTVPTRLCPEWGQIPDIKPIKSRPQLRATSNQVAGNTALASPSESCKLSLFDGSDTPDTRNNQGFPHPHVRKRAPNSDYTASQLSNMTYDQLSNESFDSDPCSLGSRIPEHLTYAALPQKLDYVYGLRHDEKQHVQRRAVFSSMAIDQYDECGDLLIERLGSIMTKYKDVRRQKRNVATGFEDEVAKREGRVREKSQGVNVDLRRLRRAGEDVVRGNDS